MGVQIVVPRVPASASGVFDLGESAARYATAWLTGLDSSGAVTFATSIISTTAFATPAALTATQFTGFASTASGATLMGYGTTGDVTLKNRAGTDVLYVGPNTTNVHLAAAASQIIPGATSLSFRNNANSADNLLITDAGAITVRSTIGGVTTLTATTLAGTLSTAAQPNVTSLGTLTALTVSGTLSLTNASPFSVTNGQIVTFTTTAQTVGAATITIPNFAGVNDTLVFTTLAQSLASKTLSSPTLSGTVSGTPTWASNQAITLSTAAQPNVTSLGTLTALAVSGTITHTSSSATAFVSGPNGATNPVLTLNNSTVSQAAGLQITGAIAAGTVALAVISSGLNASATLDAKGTGTIGIGTISTGAITLGQATTITTGGLTVSAGGATVTGIISTTLGTFHNYGAGTGVGLNRNPSTGARQDTTKGAWEIDGDDTSLRFARFNSSGVFVADQFTMTAAGATTLNGSLALGGNNLTMTGTISATGARVTQSYHTNITSTNAVTVDSSLLSKVLGSILDYGGDALAILRGVRVVSFRHRDHLDPSQRTKLGLVAETIAEPLALQEIENPAGGTYPGVNLMGLLALQTRAIQQLEREVEALRAGSWN